jgi:hypothetical protein
MVAATHPPHFITLIVSKHRVEETNAQKKQQQDVAEKGFQGFHQTKLEETYLTVNNGFGKAELADHAKRNGSSARLGIVKLALEHDGVNVLLLGEDLGSACSGRSSSNDGDLVLHAERRGRCHRRLGDRGRPGEGRGAEGRHRSGDGGESKDGELHDESVASCRTKYFMVKPDTSDGVSNIKAADCR